MLQAIIGASRALTLVLLLLAAGQAGRVTSVQAASASSGCGRAWAPGSNVQGALSYDGVQRTYLLHIPTGYTATTPLPLLLNLHGAGMNAWEQALLTHMSATADANGFLVVYPNGTGTPSGWNVFPEAMDIPVSNPYAGTDDVGFLSALVASLEEQTCVDTSRIGVAGFSLGAAMAYHLACADTPWLAAIASVGGTMPQPVNTCTLAHPTPLIAFHGADDPVVPYQGKGYSPPSPEVVAIWARLNGCAGQAQTIPTQGDVSGLAYGACAGGADAQLYTVTDGGHTWPGGYPLPSLGVTTDAVDASSAIYAFVAAHPLSSPAASPTAVTQNGPGPASTAAPSPTSAQMAVLPAAPTPAPRASATRAPLASTTRHTSRRPRATISRWRRAHARRRHG